MKSAKEKKSKSNGANGAKSNRDMVHFDLRARSLNIHNRIAEVTTRSDGQKISKSLFWKTVKSHMQRCDDYIHYLEENPTKWKDLKEEIFDYLDQIFDECCNFEALYSEDKAKIERIKSFFANRFRKYIRLGSYNQRVIDRPFGYAGDFLIIDDIYRNKSNGVGIERILDDYFLQTPASIATRNRKEDFKRFLAVEVAKRKGIDGKVRVLDLASGPCRDAVELYQEDSVIKNHAEFYCVDNDLHAIEYSKKLVSENGLDEKICINYLDVVKLALTKNPAKFISPVKYDIIYSTGLFDYLNDKISVKLISRLRSMLNEGGLLIISNYTEKINNGSRLFMEWGGDWELIYRSERDFMQIFKDSGFENSELSMRFEDQHIMQYCFAHMPYVSP